MQEILEEEVNAYLKLKNSASLNSLIYIEENYENKLVLISLFKYFKYFFLDGFPHLSNTAILFRIGPIPSKEVYIALINAINEMITGSYREAYISMRRSLEMMVIAVLYGSTDISREETKEARQWATSKGRTPRFYGALKRIMRFGEFEKFNASFPEEKLGDKLKEIYENTSKIVHVRGIKNCYFKFNRFSTDFLKECLDLWIELGRHICILLTLHNPILLVGEPFDRWEEFDGFYSSIDSKLLLENIPNKFHLYFNGLRDKIRLELHNYGVHKLNVD